MYMHVCMYVAIGSFNTTIYICICRCSILWTGYVCNQCKVIGWRHACAPSDSSTDGSIIYTYITRNKHFINNNASSIIYNLHVTLWMGLKINRWKSCWWDTSWHCWANYTATNSNSTNTTWCHSGTAWFFFNINH